MASYTIKRNVPILFPAVALFIVICAVVFIPWKEKTITGMETYTALEPSTELIAYNATEEVQKNTTVQNLTKMFEAVNYTLSEDGEIYKTSEGDLKYANQDYVFEVSEKTGNCAFYEYTFYENKRVVDDGYGKICPNVSKRIYFTVKEIYVGDIDDHFFRLKITEPPKKQVEKVVDSVIPGTELVNVIKYRNVTVNVNVEKNRTFNTTVRTWLFG
jgi:hypothetical protein